MSLKVSRILHAGYVFKCGFSQIAFDPIFENPFSRNCYAFPSVQFDAPQIRKLRLDAVFISHFHDDHCSLESLNLLDRDTPIYLYCVFRELFELIRGLGFSKVHSLKIDEAVQIGEITVIARRALDADVDSIFQVRAGGLNVLNVVDSWIDDDVLEQLIAEGPWDLILWPFQTMRELEVLAPLRFAGAAPEIPREWILQLQKLRPRFLVPSSCQFVQESWSWYNQAFFPISYKFFAEQVGTFLPETSVVRMNPSNSFVLDRNKMVFSESLNWVIPVGNQAVDYIFDPRLKPPTTADVAKRFETLTPLQMGVVDHYCTGGILKKLNSFDQAEDGYFSEPKVWQLRCYDHAGTERSYFYQLAGGRIHLLTQRPEKFDWLTEVPQTKLYAALTSGESLTSMYVRINDVVFDPKTEEELTSVDVLEDPLIRSLYTADALAYQRAQFKKVSNEKN